MAFSRWSSSPLWREQEDLLRSVPGIGPVVTVTLLAPAVAVAPIDTTAAAPVAEVTVSELTVIPVPKVAVLVPCTQCVN